jgi:hypothetical protein
MKYLKTFEGYNDKSLAREVAEDILPKIREIRDEKGIFTIGMFDNYMEERGGNMNLTDEVISELVDMGFDFDPDEDDVEFEFEPEEEKEDLPPPPPGFEGYPGMEYSLN